MDGGLSTLTPHMVHQEMVTLAMEPEPRSLKGPPVSGAPDSQQQQEQPRGKAVAAT